MRGKSFKSKEKKRNRVRGGEKIKLEKKKLKSGLRKGKEKNSTWDGTGIEKRILSRAPSIHVGHWWVLVHSGPQMSPVSLLLYSQYGVEGSEAVCNAREARSQLPPITSGVTGGLS